MSVRWSVLAPLFVLMLLAVPLRAQTLGDLAREEAERRKSNPPPARVITNKDLPPAAPRSASPAPTTPAADAKSDKPAEPSGAAAGGARSATDAGKDAEKDISKEVVKDEKYWSDRFKDLNEAVARD